MLTTKQFLQQVITCPEPGYFYLAVSNGSGWLEQWHHWPEDIDKIAERAEAQCKTANVYFSTYLFKSTQATRSNILPTRTIQADLDDAELSSLPREASILIETSPGRHQGYWILDRVLDLEQHEELSRKITYSIPMCDRSGWPLGRKVRLPNTFNHKYLSGPKSVTVAKAGLKKYTPEEFEDLLDVPRFVLDHFDEGFLETPDSSEEHPRELLEKIRERIPSTVYITYDIRQADRSAALYALMCYAFKAGLNRKEVFTLAKESANNKFEDLRYRADQALAKDVLRAELTVNSTTTDAKQLIRDLFKASLPVLDRKKQIASVVLESLKNSGVFIRASRGFTWYIRRDSGKPIQVSAHAQDLFNLLDLQFGLNFTEPEAKYVAYALQAYSDSLPPLGYQSALAHYDISEKHLLLHTGRKSVIRISATGIERVINGAYDVVFPWSPSVEEFVPTRPANDDPLQAIDWGDELFGDGKRGFGSSVKNLTNLSPEEGMALLKTWFIFVLMRNAASARPIIAMFGQPGSGKSTAFKKVFTVLYGRHKSIGAVTSMDDFDHVVSTDPLVVLDNVDTWEKWLPDRIALSAGTSDIVKRQLFTDASTVTLKRQALVGITAHNPQFNREDVADRFLLFAFKRFPHFVSEERIHSDLHAKRNMIWGAVVDDVQKVLSTPEPQAHEAPQFRIEDFALLGLWIARGLGCEAAFRASIGDVKSSQQNLNLEEEGMLVNAVVKFAATQSKRPEGPQFYVTAEVWNMLVTCCDDERAFVLRYKNAVALSKKLSSMQDSLTKVVDLKQQQNEAGVRVWRFSIKAK